VRVGDVDRRAARKTQDAVASRLFQRAELIEEILGSWFRVPGSGFLVPGSSFRVLELWNSRTLELWNP